MSHSTEPSDCHDGVGAVEVVVVGAGVVVVAAVVDVGVVVVAVVVVRWDEIEREDQVRS